MHAFGVLLLLLLAVALGDDFTSLGCFKQSAILSLLLLQGEYIFQTSSYCWSQCPSEKVAALLNGKYCYCGLTVPNSDLMVDDSNCNTPCQGYGLQTCGGNGYFQVYVNDAVSGSTEGAASSTAASSSSSEETSSQTSSEEASSAATSSSEALSLEETLSAAPSLTEQSSLAEESSETSDAASTTKASLRSSAHGVTTIVSTVTSAPGGSSRSVIEITTTVDSHSAGRSSSTSSLSAASAPNQSKSLSGGKIAGAVVGSVAGVALISGLIFLILHWKRNRSYDDDDDFFDIGDKGAQPGQFDSVAPNAFIGGAAGAGVVGGHAHHNSNTDRSYSTNNDDGFFYDNRNSDMNHDSFPLEEEYGRRRLSNGSLPDMVTRNPGSLKVVN